MVGEGEWAEPVALTYPPSAGAPEPILIQDDHAAMLVYRVQERQPVNFPAEEAFAVLRFSPCHDVWFGGPNDEGLAKHRLYGKGLTFYGFHIVRNSQWASTSYWIEREGIDPPGALATRNHYVLTMHDSTLECLAQGYTESLATSDVTELLRRVQPTLRARSSLSRG